MVVRQLALPLLVALALVAGPASRPDRHVHAQQALPDVSYICPMAGDEDVNEGQPGRCRKCGMDLVPVRIDLAWTCPVHRQQIMRDKPGSCPIDRRELVQVTIHMYWTCPDKPTVHLADPGTCADGTPRLMVRELPAHGDHNPRHGGLLFMAENKWHHIEGTYPRDGLFRLYVYDNFTQPMAVTGMTGRLVTREENNREIESFPLKASGGGRTLDAAVRNAKLPFAATVKIKLDEKTPEARFDFTFAEHSKEPPVGTMPVPTAATPAQKPAAAPTVAASAPKPALESPAPAALPVPAAGPATPAATPSAAVQAALTDCSPNMSRTDVLLASQLLPKNSKGLVGLLATCTSEVEKLIHDGQSGYVYQPTMLGKDVALALEGYVSELPGQRRAQAAAGIRRVVLAAWQLDLYGDMGDKGKLTHAFTQFSSAVADIKTAYGATK
jgi:hypothetical protein